jgi:uncharacterized phage protein (TIGR01671 family)
MREIKFRALYGKEWIYSKPNELADFFLCVEGNDIDETVSQFTGLKDKNNKEIFEGDIIRCSRYSPEQFYDVKIEDIRRLPDELFGSNLNWREVISNIYQK